MPTTSERFKKARTDLEDAAIGFQLALADWLPETPKARKAWHQIKDLQRDLLKMSRRYRPLIEEVSEALKGLME